jgi:PII-like signaling protein
VIVDTEERLRTFVAGLHELGIEGLATLEQVEVLDLAAGGNKA